MIHRIVLFLKFAPSSEDLIEPYGIERALPLTVRLFKVCGFKRSHRAKFLL